MAYTALYRKFRPLNFNEMVGQEHITKTLKNQIMAGRVGHAYLFNGGRGTGKTSAAKIMARAVNCLNPKDGEPCNECEICKAIISGNLTDVVEMDAASNNSVEDIRAIRDEVNFLPSVAKYRVYIIDEVHMLSIGAFNALLKTLEEPPEHAKFILATTEPQKLPATILSRCQRFDFKRISTENIVKRLEIICKESNIEITQEALKMIAILSEGAMRDAISILERCAQDETGTIDEDKIRDLVGIPKLTYIRSLAKSILEKDIDTVMKVSSEVINEGKDLDNFLWEIIKYVKDILILKTTNQLDLYSEEEKNFINELSKNTEKEKILDLIYELSELAFNLKKSVQKSIIFQTGMIKACVEPAKETVIVKQVEQVSTKPNKVQSVEPKQPVENKKVPKVQNITSSGNYLSYWSTVLDNLKSSGKVMIYTNLIGTKAVQINDMTVGIEFPNKITEFAKKVLDEYENKALIQKLVSEQAGAAMHIQYIEAGSNTKNEKINKNIDNSIEDLDIPINIIDE